MFSGIIQSQGKVKSILNDNINLSLEIMSSQIVTPDLRIGDSIAIDGVCLTVVSKKESLFIVDVMPESVKRTKIDQYHNGTIVNLERSLKVGDRLDGHIVQGHIDFCTTLIRKVGDKNSLKLFFTLPNDYQSLIVEKGSIAVDGVSLTVVKVSNSEFEIDLIPHTQNETTLENLKVNDAVNIETDILGKYVEKKLIVGSN